MQSDQAMYVSARHPLGRGVGRKGKGSHHLQESELHLLLIRAAYNC